MKKILIIGIWLLLILSGCANNEKTFTSVEVKKDTTIEIVESLDEVEIVESSKVEDIYDIEHTYTKEFRITAYCACEKCCGKSDGITATGTIATEGRTIAVDPSVIPYGTKVIINGNTYIAEDCGGAIKENRIDIYFNNHQDALNWGVQTLEVTICLE